MLNGEWTIYEEPWELGFVFSGYLDVWWRIVDSFDSKWSKCLVLLFLEEILFWFYSILS